MTARGGEQHNRVPLTPSLLVAAANAFVGFSEVGGENRGQMVDRFLAHTDLPPGHPWCAAFVSYVGYWSHFDHVRLKSDWPLPRTASCWQLGQFARERKVLTTAPHPGDVFLIFDHTKNRFAHTGIVLAKTAELQRPDKTWWFDCLTIEGNTNTKGSRDGDAVLRRTRRFYPSEGDRFIHWVMLDRRDPAPGVPDVNDNAA